MRQLAIEQQAIESSYPTEVREAHDGETTRETTASARAWEVQDEGEDEVGNAEEMTVVAAAAAASMRNSRQCAMTTNNNKPRWHPAGGANGFNNLSGGSRTKPGTALRGEGVAFRSPLMMTMRLVAGSHAILLTMKHKGHIPTSDVWIRKW